MDDEKVKKQMAVLVGITIFYLVICYPATQCFFHLMGGF